MEALQSTRSGRWSGILLFLAGAIILMGIITSEAYYPAGYTTRDSEISDLGSTRPPESYITQPSAAIFNTTMLVAGAMILLGAYFLYRATGKRWMSAMTAMLGLGVLGVGIFPGNHGTMHPIFAMTAFIFGGLAATSSAWVTRSPFRYAAAVFGTITLITLFFAGSFIPLLGDGGTERWVAYPVVLWLAGFGGYLLGQQNPPASAIR